MAQKNANAKGTETGTWPGGTHNPGEPNANVVRRHLRVPVTAPTGSIGTGGAHGGMPMKGKVEAEQASGSMISDAYHGRNADRPGVREVFVVVQGDETPVFAVGDEGKENAVAVFSSREKAVMFLQQAHWQPKYDPRDLSPPQLEQLVEQARNDGVNVLAVDFSHQGHTQSNPDNFVRLDRIQDRSGENLYREVWDRGNR